MSRYTTCTASGQELLDGKESGEIRLWAHNREVSRSRAATIAALAAESGDPWFFGAPPVYMCRTPDDGAWDIIDGQHRLEALSMLENPSEFELTVVEVAVGTEDEKRREFERINSGTPVPAAYWNDRTRETLSEFAALLRARFPGAEHNATAPQRPRYNAGRAIAELSSTVGLRDAVCAGRVTAADLLRAAELANEEERARVAGGKYSATPKCVRRAEQLGFYLGMNKTWPGVVALLVLARLD